MSNPIRCRYFVKDSCKNGDDCRYSHDPLKKSELIPGYHYINPAYCSNKDCTHIKNSIPENKTGTCCGGCAKGTHTKQCEDRLSDYNWANGPYY